MTSKAASVAEYLATLPPDRKTAIEAVRKVILKNLDKGFEEGMLYGMIGYFVPHKLYPAGYHCNPKLPLPYAALASQKNYMSLYLMSIYAGSTDGCETDSPDATWFKKEWAKTGKKLDMGKSCVRFKKLEDLPLELIGKAIARIPLKRHIELYESLIKDSRKKPAKTAVKKAARKSR